MVISQTLFFLFLHEHDNRLNNVVCVETTFAVYSPEIMPNWVSHFLQKPFRGSQHYFRVYWDMLVVHESSGRESYKG